MKASYVQKGNDINYKNETDKLIERGEVVIFGDTAGVAADDIQPGLTGVLHLTGAYTMPKVSGTAIDAGAAVYYDTENDCVTTTENVESVSNVRIGTAITSAEASDSSVLVRMG